MVVFQRIHDRRISASRAEVGVEVLGEQQQCER